MRRLTLIGKLLMVLAFVMLGLFVVIPSVVPIENSPFMKAVLQAAFCKPGDTLSATYSEYDTAKGSTISTDFSCKTNDHQSYEVGGRGLFIGFFGFIVPFLGGLFLWSIGAAKKAPPKQMQSISLLSHLPLAQQLTELQSALDARLITEDEYAARRKEILNQI